jgi:serine/threonine protein kinase
VKNGSLQNVLKKEPHSLPLRRKLSMARQIASGMRRIHQHGMVHRDIRPDNILVTDTYQTKIGDMGITRVLDPTQEYTRVGCDMFMPPEFYARPVDGPFQIDEKLDIYTYGLTINQLFTEMQHSYDRHRNLMAITKKSPVFYDEIISKCLDNNPKRRPSSLEIEKTLQLYEEAFEEIKRSDAYAKMNTQEKDELFMNFYQKNKSKIQNLINERLHQERIPGGFDHKHKSLAKFNEESYEDPCRIN